MENTDLTWAELGLAMMTDQLFMKYKGEISFKKARLMWVYGVVAL